MRQFYQGRLASAGLSSRLMGQPMDHKMIRVVLTVGCLLSSSIASPILFELQVIWMLDVFVFFVSAASLMVQNLQEIKSYGHYTLAMTMLIGVLTLPSVRSPLKDLVPWIPVVTSMLLLFTVYFLPSLRQSPACEDVALQYMELGHPRSAPAEPMEAWNQSNWTYPAGHHNLERIQRIDHTVSHMDRHSPSNLSQGFSVRGSSIALSEPLENSHRARIAQRVEGSYQEELIIKELCRPETQSRNLDTCNVNKHSQSFRHAGPPQSGSSIPSPMAVHVSSTSEDSTSPLLG